jgi:hypothetical protein
MNPGSAEEHRQGKTVFISGGPGSDKASQPGIKGFRKQSFIPEKAEGRFPGKAQHRRGGVEPPGDLKR